MFVCEMQTIKDYFVPEFADRVQQIGAFEEILRGRLKRTAILIRGEAEIGKSFLLNQFWYMAHGELISRLDFRDGEVHTFLSIIQSAIEDLGRRAFAATIAAIQKITQETRHDITIRSEALHDSDSSGATVSIKGKTVEIAGDVVGRDLYRNTVFLPPTENLHQRQALQQEISSIFFDDLRAASRDRRIVLSYDSFESAPEEAQQWLTGLLLDEIARGRLRQVIVIIAGRAIPNVSNMLVPYSAVTELRGFDPESAMEYLIERRGLSEEHVQKIYAETGGHPKLLAEKANFAGGKHLQYQIMVI